MKPISIALFAGIVGCTFVQPIPAAEAAAFTEKVLWSFGSGTDGQQPDAGLIDVNGTMYGTTGIGGIYGEVTVFALDPSAGGEKVLYSFCTRGKHCLDGSFPQAKLIHVKGKLYGTTSEGGPNCLSHEGCGTVFSLDPNTGKEKLLHAFDGADGQYPWASVIDVKGMLYGTTAIGGAGNSGAAFALDPKSGTVTVLHSFCSQQNCTDGGFLVAALIDVNGTLYGTTQDGGTNCQGGDGCGTVYSLDPATGAETVVYSFCGQQNCTDGAYPYAGLIDVNGMLYGTTFGGGANNPAICVEFLGCGTVFSVNPTTGAEKVLYSFCSGQNCADGQYPDASLIDVNGILYGTTDNGGGTGCGGEGCGTVFSIDPNTGAETVLHSFLGGADGARPFLASLIAVKGTLYGTTEEGGGTGCHGEGCGTVFVLKPKPERIPSARHGPRTLVFGGRGTDGHEKSASAVE